MLVLTQSDELSRAYGEDAPSLEATRRNGPYLSEGSSLQMMGDGNSSRGEQSVDISKSPRRKIQQGHEFKDTEARVMSTGSSVITKTSAAPSPLPNRSQQTGQKRQSSLRDGSPALSRKKKAYRLAGLPTGNVQKQRVWEVERKEGKVLEEEEKTEHNKAGVCSATLTESAGGLNPSSTITTWEASWNITNAIQGIFVLALPFALLRSGYAGLVLMVLSAWVCNHTGQTLVACLYEEERSGDSVSKVRVRRSYQDVMEACCQKLCPSWTRVGGAMVSVAQVVELAMTCSVYLLVSTGLLSDSLSGGALPRSLCLLASMACLVPCVLLTDLRPVSTLSLLCSLAHALISLLVVLFCLSRASSWSSAALSVSVNPEDFLVSVGVIIFSYTSQIFLPPLEGSMEHRGQFRAMLGWTHAAACLMKTLFSLTAVLTWGSQTKEVVTDNLPSDLRPLLNLCLLAKALLSFPLPFYSAAAILQNWAFTAPSDAALAFFSTREGRRALAVRGVLLLSTYLLALTVPSFSLLMGLTGSVSGAALTLILPCLFHLTLRWRQLSVCERLTDMSILSFGLVCSVSGVVCSVRRLIRGL